MLWSALIVGLLYLSKPPDYHHNIFITTISSEVAGKKPQPPIDPKDQKEPLTLHHVNDVIKKLLKLRKKKPKKYKYSKPDILFIDTIRR